MANVQKSIPTTNPSIEDVPVAQIVFGSTPNDDDTEFLVDDDGIWTDYQIVNRYEEDKHLYMMGITSPSGFRGNNAAFVQLAAPTVLLVCDWTAERIGEQPDIPNPEPQDPNLILLDEHKELEMVLVGADGNNISWRINGTYVYGFKNSTLVRPVYPRAPWIKDDFDRKLDSEAFVDDLRSQKGGT